MAKQLPKQQGGVIFNTEIDSIRSTDKIKTHSKRQLGKHDGHFNGSYICLQRKHWYLPYNFFNSYIFIMLILSQSFILFQEGRR